MNEDQTQPPLANRTEHIGLKIVLIFGIGLLLIASAAYGAYAWQQSKVDELESKVKQLEIVQTDTDKPSRPNTNGAQLSEDEKVTAAFNQHCETIEIPEGFVRNTLIGTITTEQKKFVYSTDGEFVALNGKCDFVKNGETGQGGGSAAYILKKVSDDWQVILAAQQRPVDTDIEKYGIPEAFLVAIGLN